MFIYGNNGHSMRSAHPLRVDRRDLDGSGRPVHIRFPVGAKVAESPADEEPGWVEFSSGEPAVGADEKAFDHVLTDAELEKEFPGYKARVASAQSYADIRGAAASASSDDEHARLVSTGVLGIGDIPKSTLAEMNARLKLRGKPEIA